MPGGASQPRRQLDAWQEWAKQRGARGLAYVLVGEDGELAAGPVAKNLSDAERAGLADAVGAQPGDCVFFAAGTAERRPRAARRRPRRDRPAHRRCIDESAWSFVWIVDAPMFESTAETDDVAVGHGQWTAVHHAFTSPNADWIDKFDTDPGWRPRLRLRHRLQRQRDRRRVDPYPPRRRAEARLRGDGPRRRRGAGEVRLPARRVRLRRRRRTAASRSAGTGSARCCRARTRSARSSRSPRPVAATTR